MDSLNEKKATLVMFLKTNKQTILSLFASQFPDFSCLANYLRATVFLVSLLLEPRSW